MNIREGLKKIHFKMILFNVVIICYARATELLECKIHQF